mmetsp:Transcript_31354/g.66711  ORF Transcript_31354/g.66711 Transcript_31354/m.66711 type:complete len:235 (-) Transcript_31354:312-1016(-)
MRTGQGSPLVVLTSILAPLSFWRRWIVSPPLPMTRPTADCGTSMVSSASGRRPRLPPPWPSSAKDEIMLAARRTCSEVPDKWTLQTSSPFSTWILAPVCCRTSLICAPRAPMIRPVAEIGNSSVSDTSPGSPPSPGGGLPPRLSPPSATRILTIARARSIWSGVPWICTLQYSSAFSTVIRDPLCWRTSEIFAPLAPMMPPMQEIGNSRMTSSSPGAGPSLKLCLRSPPSPGPF